MRYFVLYILLCICIGILFWINRPVKAIYAYNSTNIQITELGTYKLNKDIYLVISKYENLNLKNSENILIGLRTKF